MTTTRMEARTFTCHEAEKMLPLVKSIVSDIVREYHELKDKGRELEDLQRVPAEAVTEQQRHRIEKLSRELVEYAHSLERYTSELDALGVKMKDPSTGVLGFPSHRAGRPVTLCWKLGEEGITHWHPLEVGYSDRRAIETPEAFGS